VPIAMTDFTDSVVFDREPLEVDGVWAIVATHPSGQQEHIIGFHSAAEAEDWRTGKGCEVWLKTRGYAGWKLRKRFRLERKAGRRASPLH
jgi:hypothetical protein